MSSCRSCSKAIVFARMSSGKMAPFESDADGEWIIVDGAASHQGKAPEHWDAVPRYTSHFAKCPAATSWRRK